MGWEGILAMVVAAPFLALPVAFVGYLTIGGIRGWVREPRKAATKERAGSTAG
ncbi:MAG: hypothetical protein HQ578_03585 [Chloroflexi bacterium]|nr:hypothetical protein [Chloroflexota bacterium]